MRARVRWGELRRQGAARRKTDQAEGVEPVEGTDRGAAAGVPLLPVIWGPVLQEDVQSCLSPGKSAFLPHEPGREGGGGDVSGSCPSAARSSPERRDGTCRSGAEPIRKPPLSNGMEAWGEGCLFLKHNLAETGHTTTY